MAWTSDTIVRRARKVNYIIQSNGVDSFIVREAFWSRMNVSGDGYGELIIFRRVAGGKYFVPVVSSSQRGEIRMMTKMGLW